MSLFTDRPQAGLGTSSFAISILVHGLVSGMLSYGFIHAAQISDPAMDKRYAVRHLELHLRERVTPPSGGSADQRADTQPQGTALKAVDPPGEIPSPSWQTPQFSAALQTLVQPDLPRELKQAKETPIPTVVIWTPKKTDSRKIVPPKPHEAASANARPSLDTPNEELSPGDRSIASSDFSLPLSLLDLSTTSPVMIQGPESLQMAPTTASELSAQPASAAALSLSDLRMPSGIVTLPPVNETRTNASHAAPAPGLSADRPRTLSGSDKNNGDEAATAVSSIVAAAPNGAASGIVADAGDQLAADHITLPMNGQFGVVVVGSSLEEEYPNLLQIWGGRIAYTVYLQVGRSKSWILQYSVLRSANTAAEANSGALKAPWPYDILVPHLIPALLNADAMVLHGTVNSTGRFESLVIVYPARTPQGTLVLQSLAKWQFRPAMQDGRATAVEVVLVIPNEAD